MQTLMRCHICGRGIVRCALCFSSKDPKLRVFDADNCEKPWCEDCIKKYDCW